MVFSGTSSSNISNNSRKRQLISSNSGHDRLGWTSSTDDKRQQRLSALAEALLAENDTPDVSMYVQDSQISELIAHPTTGPSGLVDNYIYRFTNIKIADDFIVFFGGGDMKQPHRKTYNVVLSNSTSASPPTTLLLHSPGTIGSGNRSSIKVKYLAQQRPNTACTEWIDEPVLLLHTRFPDNMWHTWTEGLLPAFQTLRELGYLPLIEIRKDKAVAQVTEGNNEFECPKVANPETGVIRLASDCSQKRGISEMLPEKCGENDMWCMEGVWPAASAIKHDPRPSFVYVDEEVLDNEWGPLYTAMGGGARSFDSIQGKCFRNLIVGTSRTLDLAEAVPSGGEGGDPQERQLRMSEALDVFVRFTRSMMRRLQINNAIEFEGYEDHRREDLRRGVIFGQGSLIDQVFTVPNDRHAALDAYPDKGHTLMPIVQTSAWGDLKSELWLFSQDRQTRTPKNSHAAISMEAIDALQPSPLGPPPRLRNQRPRPVVTYITRWSDLSRSIINERQVLRYIYWRYNVTLKVTSLTEHAEAVAQLLQKTDVLIGSFGNGWAQSVFLKQGAGALQLLPYGWRREDGSLLRGDQVSTILHLRRGTHLTWVNPHAEFSFFRREDFKIDPESFRTHPDPPESNSEWSAPHGDVPHPAWLNANTYADLSHLGPYIDAIMQQAGIRKMNPRKVAKLNAARIQEKIVREQRLRAKEAAMDASMERGSSGDENVAAAGWEATDEDPDVVRKQEDSEEGLMDDFQADDEGEGGAENYATTMEDDESISDEGAEEEVDVDLLGDEEVEESGEDDVVDATTVTEEEEEEI